MEKQNYQERDFNLVAKILLGLSMITTGMAIFNSMLKFGFIEYANVTVASLIIEIVLDVLILIAGFAVFLKHRWGLIALAALFTIRMFATIPLDSTMYSYQLGGNMVHFFRDFGLFAIAMCFKKNGVSGWRLMLASEIQDANSTTEDSIGESVVEQNCIENTPDDMGEIPNSIQEEEVLTQNTTKDDEADTIEEQSPIITIPAVDNKEENGTVETKKANSPKRRIKRGIVALSILSLIFVGGGISLIFSINSKNYSNYITRLDDKFKYYFSIPNNRLAKELMEKFQKAETADLTALCKDYTCSALDANPNRIDVLKSIANAFCACAENSDDSDDYAVVYYLDEVEHIILRKNCEQFEKANSRAKVRTYANGKYYRIPLDKKKEFLEDFPKGTYYISEESWNYHKAIQVLNRVLSKNPSDIESLRTLTLSYLWTNELQSAYRTAEQLLYNEPYDDVGLNLMCIKYYNLKEWNNLLKWGEKCRNIDTDSPAWAECIYLYAKALYETGSKFDAMRIYAEAENIDPFHWLHAEFEELGGIPCSILSLSVGNEGKDGTVIDKPGETIYSVNTCYLIPYVKVKSERSGTFNFDVKLYENGSLIINNNTSPIGYSYSSKVKISGLEEQTIEVGGWGSDKPGHWERGNYRFEIWWKGNKLYSQSFKIY